MTAPLGYAPQQRPLILSDGADFTHSIRAATPLPGGTTAWIDIWDSTLETLLDTWDADVADTVDWTVPAATADAIPAQTRFRLFLSLPTSPTTEHLWFYGPVVRRQ